MFTTRKYSVHWLNNATLAVYVQCKQLHHKALQTLDLCSQSKLMCTSTGTCQQTCTCWMWLGCGEIPQISLIVHEGEL